MHVDDDAGRFYTTLTNMRENRRGDDEAVEVVFK
jgi:hypothetical protein